jgi:hypothetical protein
MDHDYNAFDQRSFIDDGAAAHVDANPVRAEGDEDIGSMRSLAYGVPEITTTRRSTA